MVHVIIPDLPTRVQYTIGAASTGPFPFDFTYFQAADVHVYKGNALLVLGPDYTLVGDPGNESGFQGGTITLTAAASSTTLTIIRELPIERVSDFPVAGSFNRQTLNTTLDKHVAMIQQVDERIDRAIVLPPTASGPVLVPNAFPQINAGGTGWELLTPTQVRTEIAAQPLDPTLTGLAALTGAADKLPYGTGPDTFGLTIITPFGRSVLEDTSAADLVATMGLGTMAQQNANAVNISGGAIAGTVITGGSVNTPALTSSNAQITGGRITGMAQPTIASEVVTKGYADSLAIGVSKRSTVRASSTVNLTLASVIAGSVLDGVTLVTSDRVLLKNQTAAAQNGVYVVGPGALVRAVDFDTYDEHPGSLVTVQEGTVGLDQVWLCISNAGGTLETTAIDWSKVQVSPAIPVVIGQGGTGQVTALAAFDALKQPATSVYAGVVREATQAEIDAAAAVSAFIRPDRFLASPLARGGYRNILGRNGGCEVWQRGTNINLNNSQGYAADGFYVLAPGAGYAFQASAISPGSRYSLVMQRAPGVGPVGPHYIEFPLDTDEIVRAQGQIVTLSFVGMTGPTWSATDMSVTLYTGTGTPARRLSGTYTNEVIPIGFGFTPNTGPIRFVVTSGIVVPANTTQASLLFGWTPQGVAGASDYFILDDMQLEVGNVATPFERRPFEQELAACMRHYWKSFNYAVAPAAAAGDDSGLQWTGFMVGVGSVDGSVQFNHPVPMRANPTVTPYNWGAGGTQFRNQTIGLDCTSTASASGQRATRFAFVTPAGSNVGHRYVMNAAFDAGI